MLIGWLVYSEKDVERNQEYINWILNESRNLGITMQFYLRENLSIGVTGSKLIVKHNGKQMSVPHFAIIRTIDYTFTKHLEMLGVNTYNSADVALICNNKALTHQTFASLNIPMVDTVFTKTDYILANPNSCAIEYPFVFKLVSGRGGKEVFMVTCRDELLQLSTKNPCSEVVMQKLCGQPGKDVRVFVIGTTIIAAVLRSSRSDFRANYSLGGKSQLYDLSEKQIKLVNKVVSVFPFGLVGIDFIFDHNGDLLLNEIEDVVGSRTLSMHSDINLVRLYLEYIISKCL